MNDWFEWNGKRCTEYGIHVSEQPPLTLPAERVTFTDVPGRCGIASPPRIVQAATQIDDRRLGTGFQIVPHFPGKVALSHSHF